MLHALRELRAVKGSRFLLETPMSGTSLEPASMRDYLLLGDPNKLFSSFGFPC